MLSGASARQVAHKRPGPSCPRLQPPLRRVEPAWSILYPNVTTATPHAYTARGLNVSTNETGATLIAPLCFGAVFGKNKLCASAVNAERAARLTHRARP